MNQEEIKQIAKVILAQINDIPMGQVLPLLFVLFLLDS